MLAQANDKLIITTRLDEAMQTIGTIIFATPQNDGSWKPTGQVPMSAENEKVTIQGSLLTNGAQGNTI
jgi:hypothetical protein